MDERAAHPSGEDSPPEDEQLRSGTDGIRAGAAEPGLRTEGAEDTSAARLSGGSPGGPGRGVSRRGLLVAGGAAVVVGGGAVAAALLAHGDGEDAKRARREDRQGERGEAPGNAAPSPSSSGPPSRIPAHPALRRLGTLKGHAGGVQGLWFSPDGRTLVSSEADVGNLRLWDVASREPLGSPLSSPYVVFLAAALTPDGRTLVTGGGDRAEFWSVPPRRPSGAPLTLSYRDGVFDVVALSPDGRTLATGGAGDSDTTEGESIEGRARLWDVVSRKPLGGPLTGHKGDVTGLLFSPDGRTLAVSSKVYEGAVQLWDVASRRPLGRALAHEGGITGMVFSPDGRTLATASGGAPEDGDPAAVRFWDVATRSARGKPVPADNWGVAALAYSGDGRTLVTVGAYESPRMRFLDAATHRERAEPLEPDWPNTAVAIAPDGVTLAAEEADGSMSLWRIE